MLPFIAVTAVLLCFLLIAELTSWKAGVRFAKPLASLVFVTAALSGGALQSLYGRAVLAALVFSWFGDVLLISRAKTVFRAGLVSFLLCHIAYGFAFAVRNPAPLWTASALVCAAWAAIPTARWLFPHLPRDMRVPVFAYLTVISLMVTLAVGAFGSSGRWSILAGALAFYLSDLAVARDRFVAPGFINRIWGLPVYYAAQLLLASTVRG
jgi:uncharacterized membrane protein YhhN